MSASLVGSEMCIRDRETPRQGAGGWGMACKAPRGNRYKGRPPQNHSTAAIRTDRGLYLRTPRGFA
eukprot:11634246-Alexandrium_andersonii.AAC.1